MVLFIAGIGWGGNLMLSKQIEQNMVEENPEVDEGWWASVLADEIAQSDYGQGGLTQGCGSPAGQ